MTKRAKALGCESCKHVLKVNLRNGNYCCGKYEWPEIEKRLDKNTGVYVPYRCKNHTTKGGVK